MTRLLWEGRLSVANSMFELVDSESVESTPISNGSGLTVEVVGHAVVNTGVWGGPVSVSVWLTDALSEDGSFDERSRLTLDLPSGRLLVRRIDDIDDIEDHEVDVGLAGRYATLVEATGRDTARDLLVEEVSETYKISLSHSSDAPLGEATTDWDRIGRASG